MIPPATFTGVVHRWPPSEASASTPCSNDLAMCASSLSADNLGDGLGTFTCAYKSPVRQAQHFHPLARSHVHMHKRGLEFAEGCVVMTVDVSTSVLP